MDAPFIDAEVEDGVPEERSLGDDRIGPGEGPSEAALDVRTCADAATGQDVAAVGANDDGQTGHPPEREGDVGGRVGGVAVDDVVPLPTVHGEESGQDEAHADALREGLAVAPDGVGAIVVVRRRPSHTRGEHGDRVPAPRELPGEVVEHRLRAADQRKERVRVAEDSHGGDGR